MKEQIQINNTNSSKMIIRRRHANAEKFFLVAQDEKQGCTRDEWQLFLRLIHPSPEYISLRQVSP